MSAPDPKLFEYHAGRFYPERLVPHTTDHELDRLEELLRNIEAPASNEHDTETIPVSRKFLAEIALTLASLIKHDAPMRRLMDELGSREEEVFDMIETYHAIIAGKYEHDQDQRIVLAALILHLTESEPTPQTKDLSRNLARKALEQLGEPPVIDEPVNADYAIQLINSLDG